MNTAIEYELDDVLERIKIGAFQYRLLALCGLGFMTDAMEMALLTFIAPCASDEWGLTQDKRASIFSLVFIGAILGTTFWGIFADKFGRRYSTICSCSLVAVAVISSALAPTYEFLLMLQFVAGVGVGGASVPFDLLAEYIPHSQRGLFLMYIQYFWSVGPGLLTLAAWLLLPRYSWRFLAAVAAVPVACAVLLSLLLLPESPRWLLSKGRKREAEQLLRRAAEMNGQWLPLFSLLHESPVNSAEVTSTHIDLFRTSYGRTICFNIGALNTLLGFTFTGATLLIARLYYNNSSSSDSGDDNSNNSNDNSNDDASYYYHTDDGSGSGNIHCVFNYSAQFLSVAAEMLGRTFGLMVIDFWGRKITGAAFFCAAAAAVFLLGMRFADSALLLVFVMLARMTIVAAASVTKVMVPELFPTRLRTVGHSFCTVLQKAGSVATASVVTSHLPSQFIGAMFLLLNVAAAAFINRLPETCDVSLDSVDSTDAWDTINEASLAAVATNSSKRTTSTIATATTAVTTIGGTASSTANNTYGTGKGSRSSSSSRQGDEEEDDEAESEAEVDASVGLLRGNKTNSHYGASSVTLTPHR